MHDHYQRRRVEQKREKDLPATVLNARMHSVITFAFTVMLFHSPIMYPREFLFVTIVDRLVFCAVCPTD